MKILVVDDSRTMRKIIRNARRADSYSLGATLYYLLTGEPPYDGDDGVETALRHVHDPIPQVRRRRGN
ncbi:MAG: hypothetical protein ACYTKD_00940 [Planctomycetota bacterium]|jgi:serine/threonine-protein kinase